MPNITKLVPPQPTKQTAAQYAWFRPASLPRPSSRRKGRLLEELRPDLHRCSVRRNSPKLFDLFVGQRDATGGPIFQTMERSNPAAPVLDSMNHNVESSWNAALCSSFLILIRRIRDV